jgi:hypothetical protein
MAAVPVGLFELTRFTQESEKLPDYNGDFINMNAGAVIKLDMDFC